jgi:hypothetical protein
MVGSIALFITSETTADVEAPTLSDTLAVERHFNSMPISLVDSGVDRIVVILVIMNPKIAPPIRESFTRRGSKMYCRLRIDFDLWSRSDKRERLNLLNDRSSG